MQSIRKQESRFYIRVRECRVILIVLPISFSMAWYEVVMQRSLVVHQENPTCHSYFLASSTRLKAHVCIASDSWDIQVTHGIFIGYQQQQQPLFTPFSTMSVTF